MAETPEEKRIRQIKTAYAEMVEFEKKTVGKAIYIGGLLAAQKSQMKHGEFMPWVKANFPFISHATANNWMLLYEHQDKLQTVTNFNEAYAIAKGKKAERPTSDKPRDDADPPPKEKEATFSLTTEKEQEEFDRLISKLGEVFKTNEPQAIVLSAVRFSYKALVNGREYSAYNRLLKGLGQGTNGKVRHRPAHPAKNRRKSGKAA